MNNKLQFIYSRALKKMNFVFCRLYPFSLQPPRQCLGPTCHLSTLNQHCIASADLPIHMIGEFSWDPKRGRLWACSRAGYFRQKNYSTEDGMDGTIGLFQWNSGCSAEQKTLEIPFEPFPKGEECSEFCAMEQK
jgi:hypothetical protein